ncbi:MAG: hypothetical protein BGO86_12695 [Chryseobacterium sp. 36-9]|nr:MAG: hypothetical protein BGO86_12695 [Chryseobacterium sp. 36-9]
MKDNKLKIILTNISIILVNLTFSQCPISFPKTIDVCLEGNTTDKNICFRNNNGDLNILFNNASLFSLYKNGNFEMGGNTIDDRKLVILGANTPNIPSGSLFTPVFKRDISYEFAGAGSAKIRSFRGNFWDTYLQFLTNSNTSSSDNPQVRMQINGNGNVGIGTTDPKAMLDVNGGTRLGNSLSNDNNSNNLVMLGAFDINSPYGNSAYIPSHRRDISYEFKDAGSAKIRSYRGDSWDTYLQFLTNLKEEGSDNPQIRMQINGNGRVGIGTTDPKELLDVNGNTNISGSYLKLSTGVGDAIIQRSTSGTLVINSGSDESSIYLNYAQEYGAGKGGVRIYDGTTQNFVNLKMITTPTSGSAGTFLIDPSGGKVVISHNNILSTPPGYKLYVEDGVLSEKFKAALKSSSQWADHVFSNDYKLRPLEEVEEYILTNKHLPEIPSANEIVKEGGLDLAQMQAKQMEKIEELTLYLIEMKKEIEALKKENTEMRETIKNKQR